MPNISSPSKTQRGFVSGRFAIEIGSSGGGKSINLVTSIDGANFKSEVIGHQVGGEGLETRYPGRQKFVDITIQVGTAMSPDFWDWVAKSINNYGYERRDGAIITYDFDGKERARRTFYDALIAEVQFPALDAKAKAPAFITVKISPERLEWAKGTAGSQPPAMPVKQKLWVPANFRFRIDGFNDMQWVAKVDPFSVKQNIVNNPIGSELYVRKEIGRIEYPNFAFYVPETYAGTWLDYWKRFVGDGLHQHENEHTGSVEYLSSDLQKTLMRIDFQGLGITGVTLDKHDAQTEQIRMVKVELYTEQLKLIRGEGNA